MSETDRKGGFLADRSTAFWIGLAVGLVVLFFCTLLGGLSLGVGFFTITQARSAEQTYDEIVEDLVVEPVEDIAEPAESPRQARLGEAAPDFTLTDLDGETVSLSDYAGRPVLINFWATWCGPCEAEMPEIHRAYQEHKDQGFVVLAVDQQEHPDTVRSFIEYYELDFPVLLDRDRLVGELYLVRGLPTTYFIDPTGTIVHYHIGQLSEQDLGVGLRKILPTE